MDYENKCLYCYKSEENLITLEQFEDKPVICKKCNKDFVVKMAIEGISLDKVVDFFKTVSRNSKKKIRARYRMSQFDQLSFKLKD